MGKVLELTTTEKHVITHDYFRYPMSGQNAFRVCDDCLGCLVRKLRELWVFRVVVHYYQKVASMVCHDIHG